MIDNEARADIIKETLDQMGTLKYDLSDINCEKAKLDKFRGANKEIGFKDWRQKIDKRAGNYALETYETAELRMKKTAMWDYEDKYKELESQEPKKKKFKNALLSLIFTAIFAAFFLVMYDYITIALAELGAVNLGNSTSAMTVVVNIALVAVPALLVLVFALKTIIQFFYNIYCVSYNKNVYKSQLYKYEQKMVTLIEKIDDLSRQIGGTKGNDGLIGKSYENLIAVVEATIGTKLDRMENEIINFRQTIARDRFDQMTGGKFTPYQLDVLTDLVTTGRASNYKEAVIMMVKEESDRIKHENAMMQARNQTPTFDQANIGDLEEYKEVLETLSK